MYDICSKVYFLVFVAPERREMPLPIVLCGKIPYNLSSAVGHFPGILHPGEVLHYKFIRGCAPQGFLLRPSPRNLVRY